MLFLWQNNGRPVLPLFKLIVSLVRLIITAVEHIFPLVLIAPLQSPWSSVTQGPFVLHVFNRLRTWVCLAWLKKLQETST